LRFAAFLASITFLTAKRFLVLWDRRDFFFGLSVVPRFAIDDVYLINVCTV
jgi:hypothetical protein